MKRYHTFDSALLLRKFIEGEEREGGREWHKRRPTHGPLPIWSRSRQ